MNIDMTIRDLPQPIALLAHANLLQQDKTYDKDLKLLDGQNSFLFEESIEGLDFWIAVIQEDYLKAVKEDVSDGRITVVINLKNNLLEMHTKDESNFFDLSDINQLEKAAGFVFSLKEKGYLTISLEPDGSYQNVKLK